MNDEKKLPKVVKTRENKHASGVIRPGVCHPMMTGRPGVFVETPEDWPEPGRVMLYCGLRVIVDGTPTPRGRVWVCEDGGDFFCVEPSDLTPIPQTQTRTVTFEIAADEDPKYIGLQRCGRYPDQRISVEARLVAIDGEEVDDE